ncbi:MAG: Hsp20/alpha crystallin family protein, partial [Flammeovirgaceae bacterium]
VKENETSFGIEVAAPGFKKEDFKVALEDGNLVISAEVKTETEDKNEKFTRKEFSAQSFRRAFSLPEVVDAAQIDANYENGILFINLPKREEVVADKRKEIAIH